MKALKTLIRRGAPINVVAFAMQIIARVCKLLGKRPYKMYVDNSNNDRKVGGGVGRRSR